MNGDRTMYIQALIKTFHFHFDEIYFLKALSEQHQNLDSVLLLQLMMSRVSETTGQLAAPVSRNRCSSSSEITRYVNDILRSLLKQLHMSSEIEQMSYSFRKGESKIKCQAVSHLASNIVTTFFFQWKFTEFSILT